jgi:hypothetical protein
MINFIKNSTLFIIGLVIGSALASVGMYFIYQTAISETRITTPPVIPRQALDIRQEYLQTPEVKVQRVQPREQIGALQTNAITQDYKKNLEGVVTNINILISNNNTVILPTMQNLSVRLKTGEWNSVFVEVKKAKESISETRKASEVLNQKLTQTGSSIQKLKDTGLKNASVEFVNNAQYFNDSFISYISVIDSMLGGTPPTSSQLSELDTKIKDLNVKTESMKRSGTSLFLLINQLENSKN